MKMIIESDGSVRAVYSELLELTRIGRVEIRRGSHVEPNSDGTWSADLSPVDGPMLGPFPVRSQAIEAEIDWLMKNWL